MKALHAALWVAVIAAVSQVACSILERTPLAALLISALAVDVLARRAGAPWDEPELPARSLARDLGLGAAIAAAASIVAIVIAIVVAGGHVSFGSMAIDALGLGFLRAMAIAYRDELLFRWIPSRLGESLATPFARAAFTTVFGAAPVLAFASDRPASVAVMLGVGALTSALMLRRESFGLIVGAHAAVIFVTSTVFSSVLDARWAEGSLVVLERASGAPGWLLGLTLVIASALVFRFFPNTPLVAAPAAPPASRDESNALSRRRALSDEPSMLA